MYWTKLMISCVHLFLLQDSDLYIMDLHLLLNWLFHWWHHCWHRTNFDMFDIAPLHIQPCMKIHSWRNLSFQKHCMYHVHYYKLNLLNNVNDFLDICILNIKILTSTWWTFTSCWIDFSIGDTIADVEPLLTSLASVALISNLTYRATVCTL